MNNSERNQQIETLIKLVELNNDPTWLDDFKSLRNGGYLPGGGAGSLNDWGPYYSDPVAAVWYSNLYRILRHLFDNKLEADALEHFKSIRFRNNIRIIRCLNCDKSYQHPSSFENHIALRFYAENLPRFVAEKKLIEMLEPSVTFENEKTNEYRNWLKGKYRFNGIKIYDFVSAKYICPHCDRANCETEHDLYKIADGRRGGFALFKKNAEAALYETP